MGKKHGDISEHKTVPLCTCAPLSVATGHLCTSLCGHWPPLSVVLCVLDQRKALTLGQNSDGVRNIG